MMEIEKGFRTPASRRSPAQMGRKQDPQDQGIVTRVFEAMKPYSRNGLSNNAAWLTDRVCNDASENLGIVMPPIGYECEMRTFRDSKDVSQDPEYDNGYNYDIYEEPTTHDCNNNIIDQGTISNTIDNETKNINNLNEFGFGYRNGYVFNKKNEKAQENAALYLAHQHNSKKEIEYLNQHSMTPLSGGKTGRPRTATKGDNLRKYQSENILPSKYSHKYDIIEDVTDRGTSASGLRRTRNGRKTNGPRRRRAQSSLSQFHSSVLKQNGFNNSNNLSDEDEMDDDFGDMVSYGNNNKNGSSKTNGSVTFNFGNGKNNDQENKEDENDNVTVDPMSWTSKFDIFAKPSNSNGEQRRESFASEYSNYTPDGHQRKLFST